MPRRTLRTLFAALALGLALAPAAPTRAESGPHGPNPGTSFFAALVPHWLGSLWDRVTSETVAGSPAGPEEATSGTASTPNSGDTTDDGLQIDPDG